ncbi:hypothetical protein EV356DRAFT_416118, partial [Viridothelium virens]
SRRRTKTGCLTCRKRRIKCGEERPICNNCIKSKRHCEGYNPRVVFKPPNTDFRVPGGQQDYGVAGDPVPATTGHNQFMGTFFQYGTPQSEQVRQQVPLPDQYPSSSEAYEQPFVQAQFPASGQPPPTPVSANLQAQRTFDYTQYGAYSSPTPIHASTPITITAQTPDTSFTMPFHGLPSEQQLPASTYPASQPVGIWYQLPSGLTISPSQDLEQAAIENEDDDYYDVHSDEDMEIDPTEASLVGYGSQHLGQVMKLHQANTDDLHARRFDSFLYAGILDSYRAEWVASPLKNPQTARVFAHFVNATGPNISIFERHTRNTSVLFSDGPVPKYEQGLWTYTMPMMALHHQGLLHAILALSSIHIAKIQKASITPSFKHYAYSLKRIRHCLGHPRKRNQITTLAASLLLGFYEIMAAEHSKWSSHLAGARQLLNEIDFAGMHKELRQKKAQRQAYEALEAQRSRALGYHHNLRRPSQQWQPDEIPDIDEGIISHLMGHEVRYDEYGHVYGRPSTPQINPAEVDLGRFEVWQDLHWWYCKQDAYQSIVSGNQLLRDFRRWSDCPPRGPINSANAVVGSNDHVFLLLARVADFAARDRDRKLKVLAANGGVWRPPSGPASGPRGPPGPTQHADDPNASRPLSSAPNTSGAQAGPPGIPMSQIPFYGMIPSSEVYMPSSYSSHRGQSTYQPTSPPQTPSTSTYDLNAATTAATAEWTRILAAVSSFPSHLGGHFQPLTAEEQPPPMSPFGPALCYRSYDISAMWLIYHMTQIILQRSHPSMPVAAMLAQGIAARQTADHALAIGRIAAGIVPNPMPARLNPSLGAALTESTMPLFFAGVQYREYAQREWLVTRVRNIEERTGWASAGLIATGCEKAWVKAYEAGRGPKWEEDRRREMVAQGREQAVDGGERVAQGEDQDDVDQTDRRLLRTSEKARLHWAMGIMGMEEDVKRMSM